MTIKTIRVWDLPTRLTHWLLFLLVTAAIVTGLSGGNLMEWHGRIGLGILGLLTFRLIWGVIGSTYARFHQFVRGPAAIRAYLRGDWRGVGHNPLGALSVLALLGALLLQTASGLIANDDIAFNGPLYPLVTSALSGQASALHREFFWLISGLVGLHLGAVLFYTLGRGTSLIRPMLTGCVVVDDSAVPAATGGGWLALIIAIAGAALVVWLASGGMLTAAPVHSVPSW